MTVQLRPNHRVCFTGKMRKQRQQMHVLAERAGLRATGNWDNADVLVIADCDYGSTRRTTKRATAEALGLPTLSESEFFAQIKSTISQELLASVPNRVPPKPRATSNDVLKDWKPSGSAKALNF
jgi:hypothetical protein